MSTPNNSTDCGWEPLPTCDICCEPESGTIEDTYGEYTFNVCWVCMADATDSYALEDKDGA